MNINNAESLLNKINRLFPSFLESGGKISAVEHDLMLSYIRELYDAMINDAPAPVVVEKIVEKIVERVVEVPVPVVEAPVQTPPPAPSNKKPSFMFSDLSAPETVVVPPTPPAPPVQEQPKPVEQPIAKPVEKPVEKPLEKAPEPPKVVQVEKPLDKAPEPPKPSPKPSANAYDKEAFDDLFKFKEATDLAQKMALSPIADLKTAIALNDKLLFINELFSGDGVLFTGAIEQFNAFQDIDQAKAYIANNLVGQYNWLEDKGDRRVALRQFIKLLRRRYTK